MVLYVAQSSEIPLLPVLLSSIINDRIQRLVDVFAQVPKSSTVEDPIEGS